jgi:DNA helicase-2/ATP-dependent DNA helicase PcrA
MDAKQEKKQMERKWSQYQEAIFQFVKTGEGNAIVEAVAGSGKTTTIVEALKHCNGSTIFLAFNKAIAEELKQRGVNAKTFHGLTFSPVLRAKPGRVLDNDKTRKIFREMWEEDKTQEMYLSFVCRLVSLGKQNGLDCLRPNSEESWIAIVEHHELELDHEDAQEEVAIEMAKKLLTASNTHPEMVDFDDMLYLSVRDGISLPKFDFVFVDEAQDTNAIQLGHRRPVSRADSR